MIKPTNNKKGRRVCHFDDENMQQFYDEFREHTDDESDVKAAVEKLAKTVGLLHGEIMEVRQELAEERENTAEIVEIYKAAKFGTRAINFVGRIALSVTAVATLIGLGAWISKH